MPDPRDLLQPVEDPREFRRRLRMARKRRGYTLNGLAVAAGLSRCAVRRIELDEVHSRQVTAAALAAALDVPAEWLRGVSDADPFGGAGA